jgi:plastocyanin
LRRGDTLEFVNAADVIHNVRFVHVAPGAKLGSASVAPYMTKPGDSYTLVIDARFTDGSYAFVCDPHQMIGMKGSLVISSSAAVASGK